MGGQSRDRRVGIEGGGVRIEGGGGGSRDRGRGTRPGVCLVSCACTLLFHANNESLVTA